jgi:hypothetical protein
MKPKGLNLEKAYWRKKEQTELPLPDLTPIYPLTV